MYRHINILLDNNILSVVSEKKIRGSLERTLALNIGEIAKHNTRENASQNALAFLMNRYARFHNYFSSETSKPRTCKNYVEEIRTALSQAGFEAPYVLMPHSISSVYSEYYASKYPEEVEAVISLDGTPTVIYEEMPSFVKSILPIAKFQQAIGTTSLLAPLTTNKKCLLSKGYTEKEIKDMVAFAGLLMNDTVLEQMSNSAEFIKQTMNLPFPIYVPYFKIISKKTYETSNQQLKKFKITPQESQHKHLERIGENAQYEILKGTHFIYINNVERIADITDGLLLKANQ